MKTFLFFLVLVLSACAQKQISEGPEGRENVREVVRGGLPEILKCANVEVAKNAKVDGKSVYEITVIDDGSVGDVKLKSTTVKNPDLNNCASNVIKTFKFPPPPQGTTAIIEYPFLFGTKNENVEAKKPTESGSK